MIPTATPPSSPNGSNLDSGSLPSVCGYLCISLTALFLICYAFVDPIAYWAWTQEDAWVEDLTAISFLLASFLLFATARMERNSVRRYIYILGGLVMVFAVGEEISWGQRIFGFATPGFLFDLNSQHEFNIHNLHPTITRPVALAQYLLCTVALAAFFCRKDRLFGIPVPSIHLILGVFMALSHENLSDPYRVFSMFRTQNALLVLLVVFTLLTGRTVLFIVATSTLAFTQAHWYASSIVDTYPQGSDTFEVAELLLGLVCLFYAAELFSAQGWRAALSGTPFRRKKTSGGRTTPAGSLSVNARSSMVHGTCASIVAGSIGLVVLGHLNPEMTAALVEKGYSRIKGAEPIIRSGFDVYLIENRLVYFKAPCAPSDIRASFFLHVIPTDTNVVSHRRPLGFDNLDFREVLLDVTHPGGRCMAIVPLPDYDVAGIRTGQSTGNGQSWKETLRFVEQPG